jgi:Protein of unknown function (DUF998)
VVRVSVGALGLGTVLMVALHLVPPTDRIDPVRRTLSEYALGPNKWIFDLAVLAVAAGSALLFAELLRRRLIRPLSGAAMLGTIWTVSLLIVVVFTKTNWSRGPSAGGVIHRYASLVGFAALPVAVLLLAGAAFPHAAGWRWAARGFGILSLSWFGLIMFGVVNMVAGDGRPWWRFIPLGLVERAMAASAVAAIAVVAIGVARAHSMTHQAPTAGSVPSLR